MPLDFDTPMDIVMDRAMQPMPKDKAMGDRRLVTRAFVQGTCLVLIRAGAFAASTLLLVLGLPLFVFLFLAGWDLALLFAQLGNLSDHYLAAEPVQRLFFGQALKAAFLVASGCLAMVRLPAFLARLAEELAAPLPAGGQNG